MSKGDGMITKERRDAMRAKLNFGGVHALGGRTDDVLALLDALDEADRTTVAFAVVDTRAKVAERERDALRTDLARVRDVGAEAARALIHMGEYGGARQIGERLAAALAPAPVAPCTRCGRPVATSLAHADPDVCHAALGTDFRCASPAPVADPKADGPCCEWGHLGWNWHGPKCKALPPLQGEYVLPDDARPDRAPPAQPSAVACLTCIRLATHNDITPIGGMRVPCCGHADCCNNPEWTIEPLPADGGKS